MKSKVRRLALAMPISIALTLLFWSPVLALPNDGTDPNSTGCSGSAGSPFSQYIDQGTLELRYSNNCQTAWARFTCGKWPVCSNYDIKIHRNQDNLEYWNGVRAPSSTPVNANIYTLQLFDGVSYQADACYRASFTNWLWLCIGPY